MTNIRDTRHIQAALDAIKTRSAAVGLSSHADIQFVQDTARTALNTLAEAMTATRQITEDKRLTPEYKLMAQQTLYDQAAVQVRAASSAAEQRTRDLIDALSIKAMPRIPIQDPAAAEMALMNARALASSVMDRAESGQKGAALIDLYARSRASGDTGLTYLLGVTDWPALMLQGSGAEDSQDLMAWKEGEAARFAQVAPAQAQQARVQLEAAREWLNVPRLLGVGLHELGSPGDLNFYDALMIEDIAAGRAAN